MFAHPRRIRYLRQWDRVSFLILIVSLLMTFIAQQYAVVIIKSPTSTGGDNMM